MLEVDQVRQCKQLSAQGMGVRAVARKLGVSRNTVRAYLRGERRAGRYQRKVRRGQPVRDGIREIVRALLVAEREIETPRKQWLTAARIHRLLRSRGYAASASVVRQLVRELKLELRDPLAHAYLPLEYEPGVDAQVDFFEAVTRDRRGEYCKRHVLLVRACCSGRCYAYIAPNQTREALLEGLMRAFEFFGGVFRVLWFDNLTPAVKKVLKGRSRELQREFECFQAHYGFEAAFCSPGKGNEKGGVEGGVKFSRHEIFSPIPTVDSRQELQELADRWMEQELGRTIRGRDRTIGEAWREEEPRLMPCPPDRFEAGQVRSTKVSPRSWVAHGTNFYSAPVEWVGHAVDLRITAETVEIRLRSGACVCHRRRHGTGEMALELDHYLPLLERKHRGLDRAVPVRQWLDQAAPCWKAFLRLLREREGEVVGSKSFVEALFLCRAWGRDAVTVAVEHTLRHPEVSVSTLRYHLWRSREEAAPAVTPLVVSGPTVVESRAADYMALCAGRES